MGKRRVCSLASIFASPSTARLLLFRKRSEVCFSLCQLVLYGAREGCRGWAPFTARANRNNVIEHFHMILGDVRQPSGGRIEISLSRLLIYRTSNVSVSRYCSEFAQIFTNPPKKLQVEMLATCRGVSVYQLEGRRPALVDRCSVARDGHRYHHEPCCHSR